MFNLVLAWIKDEIIVGKGLHIRVQRPASLKNNIDMKQRRTLYLAYRSWCERQGYKPISRHKFGAITVFGSCSFKESVIFNSVNCLKLLQLIFSL